MKVGIFTDSYKPYTSGVVTSINTFKEELARLGHEIYIFAPNYPNYEEDERHVYRYYSLPAPTNPDYTLAVPVYPGMRNLLNRLELDVIHVHSPFTMGRVGLHYAKRYGLPLLFTYHTLYDEYVHYVPVPQEWAKDFTIKYSSSFCNQCNHIIAPSAEVANRLRYYKIKTPVSIIPTGVPLHRFETGDGTWLRNHYDIPPGNKVLLFVGRLTKEKNLEFLIESFARVREKHPQTTLVLTAQGPLEADLKKQAMGLGLSMDRDIIFTGALPFDTLVNVYFSADLFVFSSVTETQGLVLIEAMAAGLPVVAVRANGVGDMVDHNVNGKLVSCNVDEFSGAVGALLEDPVLYAKYCKNALIKANKLSAANMAHKLESVYEISMIRNNRRPKRIRETLRWMS